MQNYKIPTKECWQGRKDSKNSLRLHEAIQLVDLVGSAIEQEANLIGFLGFASDEGIRRNRGHVGAGEGPDALRRALSNLPVPNPVCNYADFGTVLCENGNLEEAQQDLGKAIKQLLVHRIFPIIMGGGHEIAWGHFQGIAAAHVNKKITIINFDSHFDLRPMLPGGKGSSGTSFTQISQYCTKQNEPFEYFCLGIQPMSNTSEMFKTASNLGVKHLLAEEFHLGGPELPLEFLDDILLHSEAIYVSICLDVFAAAFAPGVSAPQSLGLLPWHVIPLLQRLASSGKVISLDIAELSPIRDLDGRTAHLATGLIYHFINSLKEGEKSHRSYRS